MVCFFSVFKEKCHIVGYNKIVISNTARCSPVQDDEKKQVVSALGAVTMTGISLLANIFVGLVGGRMVDAWLGSSPWGLLTGVLLGVFAGFWSVYKRITGKK
jgi:ATP synthase protein I